MADYFLYDGDMICGRHVDQLVVEGNVVATDVDIDYASGVKPKHAIRVNVKIGDQQTAPGKEALGMRDMMPVDFHRERDYWPTPGKQHLTAFGTYIVEDTPDNHAALVSAVRCVEDEDGNMIRQRAGCHDAKKIEAEIGCPGIVEAWRSASVVVCVIGVVMMPTLDAKPSAVIKVDRNAVTAGSYTVGGGIGDDYATWAAAFADIANLTDDLAFTLNSDVTENATSTITENLNGHTFTCNSNSAHAGDPTAGYQTTTNGNFHYFNLECEGAGTVEIYHFRIVRDGAITANYAECLINNVATGFDCKFHDNMIDKNAKRGFGFYENETVVDCYVWNNVMWGGSEGAGTAQGIWARLGNINNRFENNTIYGFTGEGIDFDDAGCATRNNAIYDCSGGCYVNIGGLTNGYNNASSDATAADGNWGDGSDNLTNQTAADDFVSTDDTNASFLDIDPTGDLDEAGTTTILGDNDTGIRGTPRPNGRGSVSIGADEPLYTPPPEDDIPTSRILKKLRLI